MPRSVPYKTCLSESMSHYWDFRTVISFRSDFFFFPVVLYGCETWSLTLREEHRLRGFENRVLRKIYGPKREEDGSQRI
jgi:hypothetical protein